MQLQVHDRQVQIRRAQPADRGAVLAVSAQIWGGEDYVPHVFDKWVADRQGELALVLIDGEVAGFGKLTMLNREEAWLEGLRMSVAYRGMGLAKLLTKYCLEECKARKVRSLRLSSYIENHESLHIVETHGFRRIASFRVLIARPTVEKTLPQSVERIKLLPEVKQTLDQSQLARRNGLLSFDFTFESWSDQLLQQLLQQGAVFGVRRGGRLVGMMVLCDRHSKSNELSISYMQGEEVSDLELLTDYATSVAANEGRALTVMCPDERLLTVYLTRGFCPENDYGRDDAFVYEHESTLMQQRS